MTTIYFKNNKCLGTDETYNGHNYDDSETIEGVPRDLEVIGMRKQVVMDECRQFADRRRYNRHRRIGR